MTPCEKRKFDIEYLESLIKRDNAVLLSTYTKLNSLSVISFKCSCTEDVKKKFCDISYYGGAYCKKCVNKNKAKKIKDTCMKIYGVDNPSLVDEIKKKKESTYIKNYGMHPAKTEIVRNKYIDTCLKKYGCKNASQDKSVKDKIKNTFNIKYNGHPMFNDDIKDKIKDAFTIKYNGHPMFNDDIKEKVKATCYNKYGGYPTTKSQEVKDKMHNTFIQKYGCHPSQTEEVLDKILKSSKSYKKYTMPSGELRDVQGYEPFALDILLKEYTEQQIITDRYKVPKIKYEYNEKNKIYFPDIYIPHMNLIIEVKSEWIYNKQLELNKIKEKATKGNGYNYEVWMFNRKGIRITPQQLFHQ
jgi:hypothetical protein